MVNYCTQDLRILALAKSMYYSLTPTIRSAFLSSVSSKEKNVWEMEGNFERALDDAFGI